MLGPWINHVGSPSRVSALTSPVSCQTCGPSTLPLPAPPSTSPPPFDPWALPLFITSVPTDPLPPYTWPVRTCRIEPAAALPGVKRRSQPEVIKGVSSLSLHRLANLNLDGFKRRLGLCLESERSALKCPDGDRQDAGGALSPSAPLGPLWQGLITSPTKWRNLNR